ncbi:MAG: methionine adenosyltransferase [Limnochordaceae bacterium]|nr:methionine adenosyltransferase [Limnochordaceae bacterium]
MPEAAGEGRRSLFTSESVTEGHPDKICDQIADAVLDAILEKDPDARVACETAVTTGLVLVMGEITTHCYVDIPRIARETIRQIGYTRAKYGFDADTCGVVTSIKEQSPDIAQGVQTAWEVRRGSASGEEELERQGAGDQGMMFGYASDETPERMPMPISLAQRLARRLAQVRKTQELPYLRPDGKTQVTVEYHDDRPVRVDTVVVSAQHHPDVSLETLERDITEHVIRAAIPPQLLDERTRFFINPTGRFVVGGPAGDTGLSGRKLIVDTYGGMGRHGGGSFSGKDPSKVDRSAAYAARYVARNLVAAGLARRVEIQLAYAIGVAHPVSVRVDSFGTGVRPDEELEQLVQRFFDLRPAAIIRNLQLRRPIYRQVSVYGHFGRPDLDLPWEREDKAEALRQAAGLSGPLPSPTVWHW